MKSKLTAKRGRKNKPRGTLGRQVAIRLSDDEHAAITAEAARHMVTTPAFIRAALFGHVDPVWTAQPLGRP